MNSQMQLNGMGSEETQSSFGMILGMDYLSNLHQKESAEAQGNLNGMAGLTYRFSGYQLMVSLSYTKELENLREDQVNDASIALFGLNTKLSDQAMLITNVVGVLALSEESREVNYFQGAIRVPMILNYQTDTDWLSLQGYLSGTVNSHEFETNFNGESNQQFVGSVGAGFNVSFTDSLFWMSRYRVSQARSYDGEVFNPVSGYDTFLTYNMNRNISLTLGFITQVSLYNDQSKLQPVERLFASSDSLFTSGITVMF